MKGKLPNASKTSGKTPEMPEDLDDYAQSMWQLVIAERGDWIDQADRPALIALCQSWSLRSRAADLLADDATDTAARLAYCQFSQTFERMLTKFGMSPVDRERLGTVQTLESVRRRSHDDDVLAEYLR